MLAVHDTAELVLTCPRCGGKLRRRSASFPRCPRCRELLITCRYCLHYDTTVLDCGHPLLRDQVRVSDPETFTECPYHASSLAGKAPPLQARLRRIGIGAGILIVAASLFSIFFRVVIHTPEHKLFMSATASDQVSEGDPSSVRFLIWNAGDKPVRQVILALNRTYLSKFILVSMDPHPLSVVTTSGVRYYYYGPLKPGEDFRVHFAFTARRPGTHRLRALLYSEQGFERREEAATTILP